jgi:polyisoprenoid-binding protein YceI
VSVTLRGLLLIAPLLLSGMAAAGQNPPDDESESAVAAESDRVIALDSAKSQALFHVRVMWLFSVSGQFGAVTGSVTGNSSDSSVRVDAKIDANAVKMRNPDYTAWVKSAEFFDVQHYPQIHFISDPIARATVQAGGDLPGTLEVRGSRQRVLFQLLPSECGDKIAFDCPAHAVGSIRRSEFGMHSRRATLGDKVDLEFSIFAQPPANRGPN